MATPGIRPRLLAAGDRLGKFDLIRQIAVGGMAEVYLARAMGHEGFEKLVVVKRLHPQLASKPSYVQLFLDEARVAATLHHPNIVPAYDIGTEGGEYYFSMEYVHGEDLEHLAAAAVENGVPLSLPAALALALGLCAGLHYAHERIGAHGKPLAVVHRDVSPSNILVSYDGGVKLVGFGGRAGGGAYAPPEPELDRRGDIYGVGAILYELTTGRLPAQAPPSTFVPSYPPALEEIVMRAMAPDWAQRHATALELQRDLESFARESELRVSPRELARLMGTLFPARLEEWDRARAQGAFFVEQHVLSTLEEETAPALPLAVGGSADEPTELVSALPLRPSQRDSKRRVEARDATPVPPSIVAAAIAPDAPSDYEVPTRRLHNQRNDETAFVRIEQRSRTPLWIALALILVAAGVGAVIAFGGMLEEAPSEAAPRPIAEPEPAPPPTVEPLVEPVVAPTVEMTAEPTEPIAAPPPPTKVRRTPPARRVIKRAQKPKPKSKKEPAWNADSPFMPVQQ